MLQEAQAAMKKAEEMARTESAPKKEAFKLEDLKCEHCHAVTEEMVGSLKPPRASILFRRMPG